ncbi:MAG TPA: peptide chain release factor N(5)-glutamine methyltransferase [Acidimicrobiales bacterium]|nr:peptide chain release factor N(5)-glutamine methyltransferase [Acidimicrobiales bacterium]
MRWRDLVSELNARLGPPEAGFAIESVTGRRPSALALVLDEQVDPSVAEEARRIAGRVELGEPLQHVLGRWGFRTVDLFVDDRALIPRPETEIVVEHALAELDRDPGPAPIVLDLGVGSGAIACALAAEHLSVRVIGVDRSLEALCLAAKNRASLGRAGARVHLLASDWYGALGGALEHRVKVIVSNPPYLSEAEWRDAPAVVREWDPYDALVGGQEGTEAYAALIAGAPRYLEPGGALVLEIGSSQAGAIEAIGVQAGAVSCAISPDLAGRPRVAALSW